MSHGKPFSRRTFLKGASAAAVAGSVAARGQDPAAPSDGRSFDPGEHRIELRINGAARSVAVEPRTTLLDALRDRLDLTGTKKICDRGSCGGCTVLVDGQPVNACMMLALEAEGHQITTIEGLGSPSGDAPDRGAELHPLQRAFVEADALQCGFCTPGMVMAGLACLQKHGRPTAAQIRREMSGNLCRCGTYPRVFEAIERTAAAELPR